MRLVWIVLFISYFVFPYTRQRLRAEVRNIKQHGYKLPQSATGQSKGTSSTSDDVQNTKALTGAEQLQKKWKGLKKYGFKIRSKDLSFDQDRMLGKGNGGKVYSALWRGRAWLMCW